MINTAEDKLVFKELSSLINEEEYGPRGFMESGDGVAHKKGNLKDGIDKTFISEPGRIKAVAYEVSNKTLLMPVDFFFPECRVLTADTVIPRMVCCANPEKCWVGQNCMGTLLNRLGGVAKANEKWELFILYWKFKNKFMGLVVRARDSKMRFVTLNPHSLDYFISRRSNKFVIQF